MTSSLHPLSPPPPRCCCLPATSTTVGAYILFMSSRICFHLPVETPHTLLLLLLILFYTLRNHARGGKIERPLDWRMLAMKYEKSGYPCCCCYLLAAVAYFFLSKHSLCGGGILICHVILYVEITSRALTVACKEISAVGWYMCVPCDVSVCVCVERYVETYGKENYNRPFQKGLNVDIVAYCGCCMLRQQPLLLLILLVFYLVSPSVVSCCWPPLKFCS